LKNDTTPSSRPVFARTAIARLTQGYGSPADFFTQKLPEGVGRIAAIHPSP